MSRILPLLIVLVAGVGCQQAPKVRDITFFTTDLASREATGNVAPDLSAIAPGIDVRAAPNPVLPSPQFQLRDGHYRTWEYSLYVAADRKIVVDRWGVLDEDGAHRSFSRADFAKAFNCPSGELEPGQSYTLEMAHEFGVMPGRVKWYVIGVDSQQTFRTGMDTVEAADEY